MGPWRHVGGVAVNVVFSIGEEDLEVELTIAPGATVADLVEALAGGPVGTGTGLVIGGRFAGPGTLLDAAGLRCGDAISLANAPPQPAPAPVPAAELVVVGGTDAGRRFPLAPGPHVVGRAGTVLLHQDTVSVRHARLEISPEGECSIEDLGSLNGTRVEGEFVVRRQGVAPGALIQLGAVQARVRPSGDLGSPADTAAASRPGRAGTVTFNRPPRLLAVPAPAPVTVPGRPGDPAPGARFGWAALVAPLVLGIGMAVLFSPVMAAFALFGPVMVVASWLEDKRRVKRERADGRRQWSEALAAFRSALADAQRMEIVRRRALLPDPAETLRRATAPSTRLWERRPAHHDAFRLCLGLGDVPWSPPLAGTDRGSVPSEAQECLAEASVLPRTPADVDLSPGHTLGVVGPRQPVVALVRSLVCQAGVHHGPADLAIAVLSTTERAAEWDWSKWLPHTSGLRAAGWDRVEEVVADLAATMAGDATAAATIATHPAAGPVAPRQGRAALLVVDGDGFTEGRHAPVRNLLASGAVSGIVVAESAELLPSVCTTVVELEGPDGLARCTETASATVIAELLVAGIPEPDARRCARAMACLEDPEMGDAAARLPSVAPLVGLLGLSGLAGSDVLARWRTGAAATRAAPTLAVPVGISEDGPLLLDLVNDGPHALVAGTTGSGKSELLRSLVAGLAASYSPEQLNFVLVDFKGGSAFGPLAGLPHVVGLVTDLDEHLGERALRCLEAELKHRELCLRRAGVSDLPGYVAAGGPSRPLLPRLVVIIDEFATMAAELPGFIDSLVGIAQRGRSLGVHLLLATQRPSGAVSDNIRANTNLRVALRVQDVPDSSDVIGTPQAAGLNRRQAGRGYVRLGHGEVVAFQAALVTTATPTAGAVVRVRPFGFDTCAGHGAQGDVSSDRSCPVGDAAGSPPEAPTDLTRLVEAARAAAVAAGLAPARRPWPEPLDRRVDLERLPAGAIGLADEPDRQRQVPFAWSPATGNLLLYGVAGSGTTTALSSLALTLSRATGPDRLHLYVLDAGTGALSALAGLPHVGAVVAAGERERQQRLLRTLRVELERRRADTGAAQGAGDRWPSVVLLIDNLGGFCTSLEDVTGLAVRDELVRLVADGPALGMVVAASADRPGAVPLALSSLVPDKLLFRLADPYDYASFGIAAADVPRMVPGRAIDAVSRREVQIAESASPGGLREAVVSVAGEWGPSTTGPRPSPIAVLPTHVELRHVVGAGELAGVEWFVPLGLDDSSLGPAGLRLGEGDHALVSGPPRSGRSTALCTLAAVVAHHRPEVAITVVALRRSPLRHLRAATGVITDSRALSEALVAVGEAAPPQLVLVDDAEGVDDGDGAMAALLAQRRPDLHVVAAGRADALRTMYGHWSTEVRRSRQGVALRPQVDFDGELWQTLLPRHGPSQFCVGRGYLVCEGQAELLQVAQP